MLTKGTLVCIRNDAVSPYQSTEVRKMVIEHGHLWLIDEPVKGMKSHEKWYWCKALSSGVIYDWREDEFNVATQEQTDAD